MSITATELKNNLGKYLLLSATEDILITKNEKVVAKLVNPHQNRVDTASKVAIWNFAKRCRHRGIKGRKAE